jgi:hypothetical protein
VWNSPIERSVHSNLTSMKFVLFAENLESSDFEFFNGISTLPTLKKNPRQTLARCSSGCMPLRLSKYTPVSSLVFLMMALISPGMALAREMVRLTVRLGTPVWLQSCSQTALACRLGVSAQLAPKPPAAPKALPAWPDARPSRLASVPPASGSRRFPIQLGNRRLDYRSFNN